MRSGSKNNTALCLFLMLTMLVWAFSLLPGTARAEEPVELLETAEEQLPAEKLSDVIVELIEESDASPYVAGGGFSVNMRTDAAELSEDLVVEELDLDTNAASASESDVDLEDAVSFAASEGAGEIFDMGFYAVVDGDLDLWLYVALPDSADPAAYQINASGRSFAFGERDSLGRYVFPVLAGIRPHQIATKLEISLLRGETLLRKFSVSPLAYLRQLLIGTVPTAPSRKAVYTGSVSGVGDYRAKLVLSSDDTAVKIFFRADDASGLSFTCDGHTVSAPVMETAGVWSVLLSGVHVNELPADFVVTGSRGDQTVTLRFSPFCYAAVHWNENDKPFIVLCRALAAAF